MSFKKLIIKIIFRKELKIIEEKIKGSRNCGYLKRDYSREKMLKNFKNNNL